MVCGFKENLFYCVNTSFHFVYKLAILVEMVGCYFSLTDEVELLQILVLSVHIECGLSYLNNSNISQKPHLLTLKKEVKPKAMLTVQFL